MRKDRFMDMLACNKLYYMHETSLSVKLSQGHPRYLDG